MVRKALTLLCILTVTFACRALAEEQAAPEVRYAAMVFDADPHSKATAEGDESRYIGYLLGDPMVGNFTLNQVELPSGGQDTLHKVADSLGTLEAEPSIAFYYLRFAAQDAVDAADESTDSLLAALPGRTKVVVTDETTVGDSGKPALTFGVARGEDGTAVVDFAYSGQAQAANSATASLLAALRGAADADRDRTITVGELASFLGDKASVAAAPDLGDLAGVAVIRYRTPAEVTKALGPDKALLLAAEYNRQQRWVEALLTLREIKDSKVTDPAFRTNSETAQLNLALESRYTGESKDDNIDRDVEAGLDLVSDLLLLANVHYVSDVDNRALFAGGIRNLQLLLENRKLALELMPGAAAVAVGEFAMFLRETMEHVYESEGLPEGDFIMRVKRVMMENDATVKLPPGAVVSEFIYGIPASLDPNTDFIAPRAYKEFQDDTKGHFGGLGIEITLEDKILTVVTPLDGTPAAGAGLLPGDRIVAIDGESTEGIDLVEAVSKLRGPVGTEVRVTIVHRGDPTPVDVIITRGDIAIESIKGYEIDGESGQWRYVIDGDNKIGYIRLTDFKESTPDDLEKVVNGLLEQDVKGLVLDLRFNHGGLLTSGVKVSDRFISDGTIVTMEGAHTRATTFKAHYYRTFKDFPLAVLVNEQSASAAEIVAGALQDNARATIIGSRTFGKGTVQTIYELDRGRSALKLTTAKYYTPSGRSIHREPYSETGGLTPDINVPMTDEQQGKLVEVWHLRGLKKDARDRLVEIEKEQAEENPDVEVADPDAFVDPQLEKALETLRRATKPADNVHLANGGAETAHP